jgi:hypothetical protein
MATKDGFNPDDFLPLFLSDKPLSLADKPLSLADEPEQQDIGNDRAIISLRFTAASILVAAATATGISFLSAGNPVTPFAGITASLADKSAPQRLWEEAALPPRSSPHSTDQPTPIIQSAVIQSIADAEALPPTVQVPTGEINAREPARQPQETDEASSEALFRKFQAWNAEQDARDLAKPVVAKNASASVRPMQKHQKARTIPNAKQTQSVQNAEPLSFLRELLPF